MITQNLTHGKFFCDDDDITHKSNSCMPILLAYGGWGGNSTLDNIITLIFRFLD